MVFGDKGSVGAKRRSDSQVQPHGGTYYTPDWPPDAPGGPEGLARMLLGWNLLWWPVSGVWGPAPWKSPLLQRRENRNRAWRPVLHSALRWESSQLPVFMLMSSHLCSGQMGQADQQL